MLTRHLRGIGGTHKNEYTARFGGIFLVACCLAFRKQGAPGEHREENEARKEQRATEKIL